MQSLLQNRVASTAHSANPTPETNSIQEFPIGLSSHQLRSGTLREFSSEFLLKSIKLIDFDI